MHRLSLRPFRCKDGPRQGDALVCIPFCIVLEKVIKHSRIQTSGHTCIKSIELTAYADDVVLKARTRRDFV